METHSSNDDIVLSANSPSDQSETKAAGVAEAALQDGEKEQRNCWILYLVSILYIKEHKLTII